MGFEFYGIGTRLWVYANGNGGVSGTWSAPNGLSASSGSIWAGTNGNTTAERQVGVRSGAGEMYMWSAAATNGARGIWLTAHGTGSAHSVFTVDTNNNVTFYGALSGNASTATKATQDGSGNVITSTYLPLNTTGGIGSCSGGGNYRYCTVATIDTNATYINGPMVLEVSGRDIPLSRI